MNALQGWLNLPRASRSTLIPGWGQWDRQTRLLAHSAPSSRALRELPAVTAPGHKVCSAMIATFCRHPLPETTPQPTTASGSPVDLVAVTTSHRLGGTGAVPREWDQQKSCQFMGCGEAFHLVAGFIGFPQLKAAVMRPHFHFFSSFLRNKCH